MAAVTTLSGYSYLGSDLLSRPASTASPTTRDSSGADCMTMDWSPMLVTNDVRTSAPFS